MLQPSKKLIQVIKIPAVELLNFEQWKLLDKAERCFRITL